MEKDEKEILRANLHWYAYARPIMVGVFLIGGLQYQAHLHAIGSVINPICLVIFLIVLYRVMYDKKRTWILTDRRVFILGGLFPWQKTSYFLHFNQIFEMFYNQSLSQKAMNYGTVVIKKSDGLASILSQRYLNNPADFVGQFETAKNRMPAVSTPSAIPAESIAAQLEKLAKLKSDGHLTEAEYEGLKMKLLA